MKLYQFLCLATISCLGCRVSLPDALLLPPPTPQPSPNPKIVAILKKLKTINTTDGISKSEATLIATCYFELKVGCGGFTGIRDAGKYWGVDGFFGYGATPIVGFSIDKSSGEITSPIGPSYKTPLQMLKFEMLMFDMLP